MAGTDRKRDVEVDYPNRHKAASKMTKAVVVLLLLASVLLMVVVTIGGWEALQGAQLVQIAYIALYVLSAYLIARWRSGMLPVVAALAVILLIFAGISGPEWFSRDKDGFDDPALDSSVLGLITLLLVPVQVLLIAFAMSGFRQAWHVELELEPDERGYERPTGTAPATA
jgi:hypothetical protein